MEEKFIQHIRQIILAHIGDEKFGVSELASEIGLSRSQVLRKIKADTGKSANGFIREIRLHESKKMIRETDLTASEIAFNVGFSSPSYFNKCFLEQFGVTPGEYKKQVETDPPNESEPIKNTGKFELRGKPVVLVIIFIAVIFAGYFLVVNPVNDDSNYKASIAVLPLLDHSENKDKAYLADGITEAITLELSKYESLRVISRSSAMMYRGEDKVSSEIARELGVDLLVEGSVLHEADSLRVVVQLIEPFPEEKHIWSHKYDRNTSRVLQLVADVSSEIAGEIFSVVRPFENKSENYQVDPQAYDLYMQGNYYCNQQNPRSIYKAIDLLKKSIRLDSLFAPAYANLSNAYVSLNKFERNYEKKISNKENGLEAIQKALALDNSSAESYIFYANILGKFEWEWRKMRVMLEKGLEIQPNNSFGHILLSNYYVVMGEHKKALEEAKTAEMLDPINPSVRNLVAQRYYLMGDFEKSIKKYNEVIELFPTYAFAWDGLGYAQLQSGNRNDAIQSWREFQLLIGNDSIAQYYTSATVENCFRFWMKGAKGSSPQTCSNPTIISTVHMMLNEKNDALTFLEIAFQNKDEDLPVMLQRPDFYPLHNEPRFMAVAKNTGVIIN